MSVGQIRQHGYKVFFIDDTCIIKDKSPSKRLIAQVKMTKKQTIFFNAQKSVPIAAVCPECLQY